MVARPTIDPGTELQRAFDILVKNWILALPTAIASLAALFFVVFLVASLVASVVGLGVGSEGRHLGLGAALFGAGTFSALGGFAAIVLLSMVAQAVVVNGAEDAWRGRPVDLAGSLGVAIARLPALVLAGIAIMLIMLIPVALSAILIGIPLVAIVGFFLIYVMPAIVIGNESGIAAIGTSFRLAKDNFGPSAVAAIGIFLAVAVAQAINVSLGHVPVIGWLAAFLVGGFSSAYAALVAARFYTLLTGTAEPSVTNVYPAPVIAGPPMVPPVAGG
jgi:hypothetical protein